jgi:ribonuclease PH
MTNSNQNDSRKDGRQQLDIRPVRITTGYTKHAEGAALIEMGETRVLCTATVEEKVPSFLKNKGVGWVTAEYAMLPRATENRTPREIGRGGPSGRTQEIQRLIGRSLRSVVDMAALGERSVTIDCDVIQADGGTRTASITGAFVALALAFEKMRERDVIQTIPLVDYVAATSVGIVDGEPLLDLAYDDDSRAEVDMNIVKTGDGRFIEVQGTAEAIPFGRPALDQLLDLADFGISQLIEKQRQIVGHLIKSRA